MEQLLRDTLHTRAQDVQPSPETWERVQARIRRGRVLRLALVPAAAAAVALVALVAVPGLVDRPDVVFPPAEPPAIPPRGPLFGCGSPAETAAVHTHQGDVWAMCVSGGVVPLHESGPTALNPALTADGSAVLFESWRDELPHLVHLDLKTGSEQVVGGGELPAFAPDGRFAYVQQADGNHPRILVGELFSEPEQEIAVQHEVVPGPLRVRRLVWDTVDDYLLYETVDHDGDSRVWAVQVETGRHELLEPHSHMYFSPAVGPDGTLAVISTDGRGRYELGYLDRSMLDTGGPSFSHVADLPVLGDTGDQPYLAAAGYAWVEPASHVALRWVHADRQSWIVGNGRVVWLVNEDGAIEELQGDTQAAVGNLAADWGGEPAEANPPELEGQDLPHSVEVTRQRIYAAAHAGDFGGLHALMAVDFNWSFGGNLDRDEAIEHLRANPELLGVIAGLLEGPHGEEGGYYVWPEEFLRHDEYLDHRLGITEDGVWRYFVAGD